MPVDFPSSPSLNDSYTFNGRTWVYDGTAWRGPVATVAIDNAIANMVASINTQTGTSYTLVASDINKIVEMNNGSANTLTVPPNSSVEFPIGTRIDVVQYGAGTTTIAQGAGVTIRSKDSALDISGQYAGATLYKRGTDEWVLIGALA